MDINHLDSLLESESGHAPYYTQHKDNSVIIQSSSARGRKNTTGKGLLGKAPDMDDDESLDNDGMERLTKSFDMSVRNELDYGKTSLNATVLLHSQST